MRTLQAVLFDYGCVLCEPQLESDLVSMAECCGADLDRFKTLYWQLRDEYDLGTLDATAYWTKIATKAGNNLSDAQLERLIELDNVGWSRPNYVMAGWAKTLRESNIKTAIISNMPHSIRAYLMNCEWLPQFDHYTFSCDINSVKPAPDIYEHCLSGLKVSANAALFLDDRPMNVDAATALGISSHVFTSHEALSDTVAAFGLPPLPTLS